MWSAAQPFAVFIAASLLLWGMVYAAGVALWLSLRVAHAPFRRSRRVAGLAARVRQRTDPWRAYVLPAVIAAAGIAFTGVVGEDLYDLARELHQSDSIVHEFDQLAYAWSLEHRTGAWTRFFTVFTVLGNPSSLAFLTAVVVMVLAARGHRALPLFLTLATLLGGGLNRYLKLYFARERPELTMALRLAEGYSFPSGHAMASVVVFGTLAYVIIHLPASWMARSAGLAVALTTAFTIGLSRVYLGVHWLSDIAAGFLVGVVWLVFSTTAFEAWHRVRGIRALRSEPSD
jgi:membrane-associated phospholipid phosphatase